ncbi:D-2-hydroxyacid dehydrogenase [Neobacillus sp. SM06]|uniref:D-2-hydroxyacid dehydrogenase n=1 Tax=Neobacillus sp. SM06 TaxID=3422492 RepID=UPI003D28B116
MKKQPNILVYHPRDSAIYAEAIHNSGYKSVRAAQTPNEAEKCLPGTEVILGWKFPTHLLKSPIASSVRWFQSTGAGVDDFVADQSIPEEINLTRIVGQFGSPIAEYVFAFLLYITKDIGRMRELQQKRIWDSFIPGSLAGKTLGVAGIGSIGAEIVRKARAFDLNVYGLSASGKQAAIVDQHFHPNLWKEFVKELDYLVLTLPLTTETRHVINRDLLRSMKADACIVNVGRGALINETDLFTVMNEGYLKAAVLDVFEKEPLKKDHPFYSLPSIYLTPHLSGPSTVDGVSQFFLDNLERFLNGEPLYGMVDRNLGY